VGALRPSTPLQGEKREGTTALNLRSQKSQKTKKEKNTPPQEKAEAMSRKEEEKWK